jgi:hypothetical protein
VVIAANRVIDVGEDGDVVLRRSPRLAGALGMFFQAPPIRVVVSLSCLHAAHQAYGSSIRYDVWQTTFGDCIANTTVEWWPLTRPAYWSKIERSRGGRGANNGDGNDVALYPELVVALNVPQCDPLALEGAPEVFEAVDVNYLHAQESTPCDLFMILAEERCGYCGFELLSPRNRAGRSPSPIPKIMWLSKY